MPFAKGMKKIEGSGIKKGQKTIASFERGYLLKYLKEEGADRFLKALGDMEDEKFVDKYLDLIEFAFPKLARTEMTGKDGKDLFDPLTEEQKKRISSLWKN